MRISSAGKISGNKLCFSPLRRGHGGQVGFTLLELLVVLVIVALMAGLAAPRMIGSLSRLSLRSSAQKICSTLRYARSQAVAEKKTFIATFDFEKNGCFIEPKKEDGAEEAPEIEDEAEQKQGSDQYGSYLLPEGVKIEKAVLGEEEFTSEPFSIEFFPSGNSSGGEVHIIDDKEFRYRIVVDFITGIVKLTEDEEDLSRYTL